jgi:flagellar assembly factor FliW
VKWLQSVDSMDLAFILMDPRSVIADYAVALRKTELDELAVTKSDELDVYTLVVVPADHSQLRTNLKAPVVINMKQRLGKQTILDGSDYPIQFFLSQGQGDSDKTQEVSSARSDA